jgi:hypothetical protein
LHHGDKTDDRHENRNDDGDDGAVDEEFGHQTFR